MRQILSLVEEKGLRVHAVTVRYKFSYYAPYNTTDSVGICHFLRSLFQLYNKLIATNYFDLQQALDEETDVDKKIAIVKKCMIPIESAFDVLLAVHW